MINRPTCKLLSYQMMVLKRSGLRAFAICLVGSLGLLCAGSNSALATDQLTEGSSSKQLRLQTVNSLPYQQLNAQTKAKISDILKKPSIYRRLPVTAINADPDYFRFLVRYPEVIVNIWQLMGVTKMATERTGPYTVDTDDGAGTLSSLELVYGSDNLHIFYGSGSYEGPVLKRKLKGKAVLVLRSENSQGANGKPIATSQLDIFLKVDNATAGLIAKTIQPLVGTTADHNFVESLKFVERLNDTTSKNGPGVQQMGKKLDIDDTIRQRFNEVVDVVFQRAINSSNPMDDRISTRPNTMETSLQTRAANNTAPTRAYSTSVGADPRTHRAWQAENQPSRETYQQQRSSNTGRRDRGAVYETLNDFGQSKPAGTYGRNPANPSQIQTPTRQPGMMVNGGQLPARGYQAPRYAQPGNYGFQYQQHRQPQQNMLQGRPVQASYNYPQEPSAQPANSWNQRR
jgi:hypothetical protein